MSLAAHLRPWRGLAYRHLPARAPYAVLDFSRAGLAPTNRWNDPGQRTLYLAGDRGVLVAEWGRYLDRERTPALAAGMAERTVYRLSVRLERVLDLREAALWAALSLEGAPTCFLDREVARAVARYLRQTTPAHGLLVPSMALLDQPERWNLVLFLDKLPDEPAAYVEAVQAIGPLRWPPEPGDLGPGAGRPDV